MSNEMLFLTNYFVYKIVIAVISLSIGGNQ